MNSPSMTQRVKIARKRVCQQCVTLRPVEEFSGTGKDAAYCIGCRQAHYDKTMEDVKEAQAQEHVQSAVKQAALKLRGESIEAPHISEVAEEMIKRFGGVEDFTVLWHGQIEKAMINKPGSKTVLDAFKDIKNMFVESTEHRASARDMKDFTDEQLAEVIKKHVNEAGIDQLFNPPEETQEEAQSDYVGPIG